jgi:hypothetical protein
MPASDYSVRELVAWRRPHLVTLSSPFPVGECLERLAAVTTRRTVASWYLDSRNALRADPRLRGEIGPARISVVRFADSGGRNSFLPRLDARLESDTGGGTTLTGTVGIRPEARAAGRIIGAGAGLIVAALFAAGAARLVSGHIDGLLPGVLAPVAAIAAAWGFEAMGVRSLRQDIPRLIGEVHEILGSAAYPPTGESGAKAPGPPPHP